MFFKKKTKEKDTNYVKEEIINWAITQNVEIQIEIILGDYRDGDLINKVGVMVIFRTNKEIELYKENGFVSKLKEEVIRLLKNEFLSQDKEIVFVFDDLSNRNISFFQSN